MPFRGGLVLIVFLTASLGANAQTVDPGFHLTFEDSESLSRIGAAGSSVTRRAYPNGQGHCLEWTIEGRRNDHLSGLQIASIPKDLRRFTALRFSIWCEHQGGGRLRVRIVDRNGKGWLGVELVSLKGEWTAVRVPLHFMDPFFEFDPSRAAYLEFMIGGSPRPGRIWIDDIGWEQRAKSSPPWKPSAALDLSDDAWPNRVWALPGGAVRRRDPSSPEVALEWIADLSENPEGGVADPELRVRGFPPDVRPYHALRLVAECEPALKKDTIWLSFWTMANHLQPAEIVQMPAVPATLTTLDIPIPPLNRGGHDDPRQFRELRFTLSAWYARKVISADRPVVRITIHRLALVKGKRAGSDWSPELQAKIDRLARAGAEAIPELVAILTRHGGDEGVEVRRAVVTALAAIGAPAATSLLDVLDFDSADPVALAAAEALKAQGKAIAFLAGDLADTIYSQGPSPRGWAAVEALAAAGPRGMDALIELLGHANGDVRYLAGHTVLQGSSVSDQAVAKWCALVIETDDSPVALDAARALASIGKRGIHKLVPLLTHSSEIARRAARLALVERDALPEAEKVLARLSGEARLALARDALERNPESTTAVRALFLCIADPDAGVRRPAFEAIDQRPGRVRQGVPDLLRALASLDAEGRQIAARLLAQAWPVEAVVQALSVALDDRALTVADTAAESLRALVPEADTKLPAMVAFLKSDRVLARIVTRRAELLAWLHGETANGAPAETKTEWMQEFLDLAGSEVVPDLRKLLTVEDPAVRALAIQALVALEAEEAIPEIRPFLAHEKPALRIVAANALYALGDDEPFPRVEGLFADPDELDFEEVVNLARSIRMKAMAPGLAKLLRDGRSLVRVWALMGLFWCGGREHAAEVARLLDEDVGKEEGLHLLVLQALGRLDPEGQRETLRKFLDPRGRARGKELRQMAACGLARVQDLDARAVLMVEGPLVLLNYYLGPATMKRLGEVELTRAEVRGVPLGSLFDRLAKKAGIRIVVAETVPPTWRTARYGNELALRLSLLDLVHDLSPDLPGIEQPLWPVAGDGEVRILPRPEARAIWLEHVRRWKEEAKTKAPARSR